jgi:hypothetical protein
MELGGPSRSGFVISPGEAIVMLARGFVAGEGLRKTRFSNVMRLD